MDSKRTNKTTTETLTTTHALPLTRELSWAEEMVVRTSRGLSEPGETALSFRGDGDEELRARLALMELELLASMHGAGPLAGPAASAYDGVKAKILARLAALDD